MRCFEHIPVLGHAIAAIHACRGSRNSAERAAINATVGIVLAPVNIVAEMVDEATRDHPEQLRQVGEPAAVWYIRQGGYAILGVCLFVLL